MSIRVNGHLENFNIGVLKTTFFYLIEKNSKMTLLKKLHNAMRDKGNTIDFWKNETGKTEYPLLAIYLVNPVLG